MNKRKDIKKINAEEIDRHVGNRVREIRLLKGFSQQELGKELGITFQQIQKYENGKNRISSSKLFYISQIFEVPVIYFFEGLDSEESSGLPFKVTPQITKLIKAYESLSDEGKKGLLNFLQLMNK